MLSKCLEPLTAIGCALGACATGLLDGGLTAGALVGGVALIARFREQSEKHGLDSQALIGKTRLSVIRAWDRAEQTEAEREAIGAADAAMGAYLADCMPMREELAETALRGERVYPVEAAALVVDRLAGCNPDCAALFGRPSEDAEASLSRRFALTAVEAALRAAKDDPDYAPLLTLDLVIQVAGTVGRIEREHGALLQQILAAVAPEARRREVSDEALIALGRRITARVDDAGQALEELRRAIDEFLLLRARAEHGTNLGALVDEALRRIANANDRGALDEGAREAESAYADWQGQQELARHAGLRLIEANIEQHRLRFDAKRMAHWICERLALEGEGRVAFKKLRAEQDVWFERGRQRGLRLELEVSVALARNAIAKAVSDADRASGQNDLGIAAAALGGILGGDAGLALLTDAVSTYHAALTVYTETTMPADWAMTQNNLGIALKAQGERTAGDAGLALLADAVSAYRAALTVYTETTMPADWAMTQNNLGVTLQKQGERTGGDAGLALLADAVAAYRAALTVRTEATMPVDWAMTQNNLGIALKTRGERTEGDAGLALLADAVAAYHAALTVRTEATMPAQWAMTQNNLGVTLQTQGERTEDDAGLALLADAVAAYRAALTVRTEATMPVQWAMTQNNLGTALRAQEEWTGGDVGLALLKDAVAAYRAALTVYTETTMPADWAMTQNNLGIALKRQGERTGGDAGLALLADGVSAYRAALRVYTAEHFGWHHELTTRNLARAESLMNERRSE